MSEYNTISRSRSKERHLDENYEKERFYNDNNNYEGIKEDYNNRLYNGYKILEKLEEEKKIIDKQRDIERQNFLRRENYLKREIARLSNQNNSNSQYRKSFHKFNETNKYNNRFSYFHQNKSKYYNFNEKEKINDEKNISFKNREYRKNNNFENKFISNLTVINNNRNNTYNNQIKKFKKKIFLPNTPGINLVGLLIGPKGIFQRLLEKQSGCKIYVNGKNITKREKYISPNDNDEANVLIIGDTEEKLKRGVNLVKEIINADDDTKNKIINEQLKVSKQEELENLNFEFNSKEYLMTSDGLPGKNSRYFKVPNDCISSIIGKEGERIKQIEIESNCKVQIGKAPIPNTKMRYIFIEGTEENYQIAKELIDKVIGEYANSNLK